MPKKIEVESRGVHVQLRQINNFCVHFTLPFILDSIAPSVVRDTARHINRPFKLSIRLRPRGNMAPLLPISGASSSKGSFRKPSRADSDAYFGAGAGGRGADAYSLPRGERGVPLVLRRLLKFGSMVCLLRNTCQMSRVLTDRTLS